MMIVRPTGNLQAMSLARRVEPGSGDRLESGGTSASESAGKIQQTLNKAFEKIRENAREIDTLTQQAIETRKSRARQKIAEIRETIRMLKQLMALFLDNPPKALLQQLKKLARQLSEAAAVLKEGGGQSSAAPESSIYGEADSAAVPAAEQAEQISDDAEATPPSAEASAAESELAALKADMQEQAEDEEGGAKANAVDKSRWAMEFVSALSGGADPQRRSDAQLVDKALQELKALVAMVKAARREDPEHDRLLKDIEKHLGLADDAVQAMSQPNLAIPAVGNISIRV